jgi:uncharacterized protein YceK
MKKILILIFASFLLSGCSCMLSQIPPQYIYAGSGCTGVLPDYRNHVIVKGGCSGFALTQLPAPGTLMTATGTDLQVTIKAESMIGNSSQVKFTVTMIDTVKPVIIPDSTLSSYRISQALQLYDLADNIIIKANRDFSDQRPLLIISKLNEANLRDRSFFNSDSITYTVFK